MKHRFGLALRSAKSLGFDSLTGLALWNHVRAVDFLVNLHYVDSNSVVAIGHSLGGHNALFLAAFDNRIKAVVCSAGFTVFARYCQETAQSNRKLNGPKEEDSAASLSMATWGDEKYMPRIRRAYSDNWQKMPWDISDVAAALAPTPLFISAPLRDRQFGKEAWKAASCFLEASYENPTWLVVEVPDCNHEFPQDTREKAYKFLLKALKEFCPGKGGS